MRITILVATFLVIAEFTFGQINSQYPLVSLHDINFQPDTVTVWWNSPLAGDTVRVQGEVIVQPLINPISNRTPILYAGFAMQAYIQSADGNPWSGLNIYQADTSNKGTLFDFCDTAKIYEFTGVVTPYGQITELALINNPVLLIASQSKRPDPVILTMDSCFNADGSFNIKLRKYSGMYVEFVSDNNHPLIVTYPPGLIGKPFRLTDNKGRYLNFYGQSIFFKSDSLYTPPPEGSNLTYIRGLLEAYISNWAIVPLYPGDIAPSAPLPVELISFIASAENGNVNISWKTASETNNCGINIERKSINDLQWSTLSFVKGSGNSLTLKQYSYIDKNINSGKFNYRLKQIDENGSFKYSDIITVNNSAPITFSLVQNYPNPFNPGTIISYSLPIASNIKLTIFNTLGQIVKTLENCYKNPGNYSISFNASNLPGGIYFYKLEAGQLSQVKKMILVK
jgi:hypothetical protein